MKRFLSRIIKECSVKQTFEHRKFNNFTILVHPVSGRQIHSGSIVLQQPGPEKGIKVIEKKEGQLIIKGWVKKIRKKADHLELHVANGGLPSNKVKVVITPQADSSSIRKEAAVIITGTKLEGANVFTVKANAVEVKPSASKYIKYIYFNEPFQTSHCHLRPKVASYAFTFQLRSKLKTLLRHYFYKRNYINVDSPTLTGTVADAFYKTLHVEKPWFTSIKNPFSAAFGHPVYLSPSGQLHLQCLTSGLNKVFSIGPSFRTTYSSGKFLYEFWTARIAEVFSGDQKEAMETLIGTVEMLLKHLLEAFLEDFKSYEKDSKAAARIQAYLQGEWKRVTYTEAVNILKDKRFEKDFYKPVCFGNYFPRKGFDIVSEKFGGGPFFITRFPPNLKPFNVAVSGESNETLSFEVAFPGLGSVVSGAVWEQNADRLQKRLERSGGSSNTLAWFIETRKWGVAPTRGFCLGIDRLMYILFPEDIKKVIPFPRSEWQCVG